MDVEAVLIETKYKQTIKSSSAIFIGQKYILTTCHILLELLEKNLELLRELPEDHLFLYTKEPVLFLVFRKNNPNSDTFIVNRAHLYSIFKSRILSQFYNNDFKDWSADPEDQREKNVNFSEVISVFLILAIEDIEASAANLKQILSGWCNEVSSLRVEKCDQIVSVSTPFGSREFFNSVSDGIVSASLMESGLFLSDCSSAPGCEGGLTYLSNCYQRQKVPIGIITSSFNWWRKDWVGFTLIMDIRTLLCGIVHESQPFKLTIQNHEALKVLSELSPPRDWRNVSSLDMPLTHNQKFGPRIRITDIVENNLVRIKCGPNWGTGILLCKHKGIVVTNSHVVTSKFKIYLFWKTEVTDGHLVYKSPTNSDFDWAVIKAQSSFNKWLPLNSGELHIGTCNKGDQVYAVGYPLLSNTSFPKHLTITKGIISACNTCMIQTSCSIYPGFSGGGIFTLNGALLGLIVCNTKLTDTGQNYPKYNMALPINLLWEPLCEYMKTEDSNVFLRFAEKFQADGRHWNILTGKL